ncbi:acyl-CoA dehydrogenase family protein [Aureimonas populi]|uniref:Acyl-CoA dehydrogenase family protein n=1 Tax=Aureimonas populi TaxID=1701758 RepID=A0ABW5CFY3_9HYPH|nr:acyl-CoA dehydrogenase family protein [Aureimonas populi]
MRHEPTRAERLARLRHTIALHAPARDADGAFPREAFDELNACGALADPPSGPGEMAALLALLATVGRGDLSTGRIFEGHVNALFLIDSFGTDEQRERAHATADEGGILGVWNTDLPADPLRVEAGRLTGKKAFASGVDGLSQAIVTVPVAGGRQMLLVPLAGLPVDRAWWRPLGMRASGSHIVDMSGLEIRPEWWLGAPDDYITQPFFTGGAVRFLAVQAGGMHAVFDAAVDHLSRTGRAGDPHQAHRLARMGCAVETAYLWLARAGEAWEAAQAASDAQAGEHLKAVVEGARGAVERAGLDILEEAERGVGAAGLIAPHPLERLSRDLRTYLRQPNPDGAATEFAAAVTTGAWTPGRGLGLA